jgi:hypothetical protein
MMPLLFCGKARRVPPKDQRRSRNAIRSLTFLTCRVDTQIYTTRSRLQKFIIHFHAQNTFPNPIRASRHFIIEMAHNSARRDNRIVATREDQDKIHAISNKSRHCVTIFRSTFMTVAGISMLQQLPRVCVSQTKRRLRFYPLVTHRNPKFPPPTHAQSSKICLRLTY